MAYQYRASVRDLLYKCEADYEVYSALIQANREFPNVSSGTRKKWRKTAQAVLDRIAVEQVRKALEILT